MKRYIFIGIGGFFGTVSRIIIRNMLICNHTGLLSLNTLIVNVSGGFLLALLLTAVLRSFEFDSSLRIGVTAGFIGAYTTFSALCREIAGLFGQGEYISAVLYIAISVISGLLAVRLGNVLSNIGIEFFANAEEKTTDMKNNRGVK